MNGVLLVDKPTGRSSHSVVADARRALGTRKVGHAGTLDPMASGLLVLGVGAATRLLTFMVGLPKTYEATVRFGVTTTTEDADGDIVTCRGVGSGIDDESLAAALQRNTGTYLQRPSSVSAIKVSGRRAYQRVRAGEDVELEPREVHVGELAVGDRTPRVVGDGVSVLDVTIHTRVSSGTYVRALARDLGESLGVGAHLTSLRRTSVGPFDVSTAVPLAAVSGDTEMLSLGQAATAVMPSHVVASGLEHAVGNGQRIPGPGGQRPGDRVALVTGTGDLLAVAHLDEGRWRYDMVVP